MQLANVKEDLKIIKGAMRELFGDCYYPAKHLHYRQLNHDCITLDDCYYQTKYGPTSQSTS